MDWARPSCGVRRARPRHGGALLRHTLLRPLRACSGPRRRTAHARRPVRQVWRRACAPARARCTRNAGVRLCAWSSERRATAARAARRPQALRLVWMSSDDSSAVAEQAFHRAKKARPRCPQLVHPLPALLRAALPPDLLYARGVISVAHYRVRRTLFLPVRSAAEANLRPSLDGRTAATAGATRFRTRVTPPAGDTLPARGRLHKSMRGAACAPQRPCAATPPLPRRSRAASWRPRDTYAAPRVLTHGNTRAWRASGPSRQPAAPAHRPASNAGSHAPPLHPL